MVTSYSVGVALDRSIDALAEAPDPRRALTGYQVLEPPLVSLTTSTALTWTDWRPPDCGGGKGKGRGGVPSPKACRIGHAGDQGGEAGSVPDAAPMCMPGGCAVGKDIWPGVPGVIPVPLDYLLLGQWACLPG